VQECSPLRSLRLALLATLVLACKGAQPIGEDPWLKRPPNDLFASGWVRAPWKDVWPVEPEELGSALQSLQTQEWLPILATQAERLTRQAERLHVPRVGKAPYLLRGPCVACNRAKSDFTLWQRGTEFAVNHYGVSFVLVRGPLRQWPVVAWLDQAPTQLYVSYGVTQ
jgi:hypothetical protein